MPKPTDTTAGATPRFISVSLPAGLVNRATTIIERYPELGYSNRSAFVEEGLRRWAEREEERAIAMRARYGEPKL